MNCEICGGENAYFICKECNQRVCSNCYDSELGLCKTCVRDRSLGINQTLGIFHLNSGKFLFSGMALILVGFFLVMIASILSAPSEEGVIVIFPFFFWRVSEAVALIAFVLFMVFSLAVILLPWLLTSKRMLKSIEKAAGFQTEKNRLGMIKTAKRGEREEYLISLKMPGFKEDDIEIEVFTDTLRIHASKDGEAFSKVYKLPKGFKPENIQYSYKDDFLLVKVSLKREKEDIDQI